MLQELLIEISEAIISDDTKTDMLKAIEINSLYLNSRDSDKVKIRVYHE